MELVKSINWSLLPSRIKLVFLLELKSILTPGCGVLYAFRKWWSVIFNKRHISFLGRDFHYQDRLAPFQIFDYLNEVKVTDGLFEFPKRRASMRVLDIGGNIGTWGLAWLRSHPETQLYSFEPNPEPFQFLLRNSQGISNWKVLNFGIGKEDAFLDFFFIPEKSGQGSVIKENASKNLLGNFQVRETKVEIKKISADWADRHLSGHDFDFIKVDVEGAEWEVMEGIRELVWNGMYVELNGIFGEQTPHKFMEHVRMIWPHATLISSFAHGNGIYDLYIKNLEVD